MSPGERKRMVRRDHETLSLSAQCREARDLSDLRSRIADGGDGGVDLPDLSEVATSASGRSLPHVDNPMADDQPHRFSSGAISAENGFKILECQKIIYYFLT